MINVFFKIAVWKIRRRVQGKGAGTKKRIDGSGEVKGPPGDGRWHGSTNGFQTEILLSRLHHYLTCSTRWPDPRFTLNSRPVYPDGSYSFIESKPF